MDENAQVDGIYPFSAEMQTRTIETIGPPSMCGSAVCAQPGAMCNEMPTGKNTADATTGFKRIVCQFARPRSVM
jgi:hypothetical protein